METALSVDHLTKSFGGRKAVDDVSFTLPEGAFLSVFGPNGAGKTTLLRMLATLSRPTEGTVTLAGIDVKEEPERVREAIALDEHRCVPIAEARKMGAMALFGEKYGDEVRVIRYGDSIELCGGTHVANTGNIGMIHIVSESSIAAGIRRIEAITASAVVDALEYMIDTARGIAALLNNAPDVIGALKKTIEENADLRHKAEEAMAERIRTIASRALEAAAVTDGGVRLVSLRGVFMPDVVKGIAFAVRAASPESTAFVAATSDVSGKPLLTVMLTDDVAKTGLNASVIVREAAKAIKGGGGGQPGFAQAGGKDRDGIDNAFKSLTEAIK